MEPTYWKKCSTCKKEIGFSTKYYLCNVSTCRHKRKGYTFCSPSCWSEHLAFANHRESWAEDFQSPTKAEFVSQSEGSSGADEIATPEKRRRVIVDSTPQSPKVNSKSISTDTLVVVSKVKKLIKEQSGFNTSQCCIDRLTEKVIEESLKAIEQAKSAERKTVMGRDVK